MKPVLDFSRRLLETTERAHNVRWISAEAEAVYPYDFVFQKRIWNSFYLPGQKVRVILMESSSHPERPDERNDEENNDWDGAIFFLGKQSLLDRCVPWYQWCARRVKPGGITRKKVSNPA